MTIITNIESVEELNYIAYFPFMLERNDLLKFDTKISYVFNNDLYSVLRTSIKNNIPLEQLIVFNSENLSTPEIISTLDANVEKFLFPFSKKKFYQTFLSNIIPTLADSVYNLLKSTNRINPIGSGLHKAYIIDCKPFETIPVFEDLTSIDPKSVSSALISSVTSLTDYINNAAFYEEQISQRDKIIEQLLIENQQIRQQIYSAYQTTWR